MSDIYNGEHYLDLTAYTAAKEWQEGELFQRRRRLCRCCMMWPIHSGSMCWAGWCW